MVKKAVWVNSLKGDDPVIVRAATCKIKVLFQQYFIICSTVARVIVNLAFFLLYDQIENVGT